MKTTTAIAQGLLILSSVTCVEAGAEPEPLIVTDRRVEAFETDVLCVRFRGGERAEVLVWGDGDTELEVFVYDEDDRLVTTSDGSGDRYFAVFVPERSRTHRIEVVNHGNVWNAYLLMTN